MTCNINIGLIKAVRLELGIISLKDFSKNARIVFVFCKIRLK